MYDKHLIVYDKHLIVDHTDLISIHKLQGTAWVFLPCNFMLPVCMCRDSIICQFYSRLPAYRLEFGVFGPFQRRFLKDVTNPANQQEPRWGKGPGVTFPGVTLLCPCHRICYLGKMLRPVPPWVQGTSTTDRLQGAEISLGSVEGTVGILLPSRIFEVLLTLQCPALRELLF